jgi:hypothetical protein
MLNGEISINLSRSYDSTKTQSRMKKSFLLIAVLFLTTLISQAQTEKGSQTLGLNLGFSYSKGNTIITDQSSGGFYKGTNETTNFNIGPAYSYFIAGKTDIGGYFSYSLSNTTYPYYPNGLSKTSAHGYAGGVFLRRYFMFGNKIGVRTGPYLDYNRVESSTIYQPTISGNNINSNLSETGDIGMLLDFVYYPVKNLGATAHLANLAFSHYTTHDNYNDSSSGNGVNFNLITSALSLSVVYAFAR